MTSAPSTLGIDLASKAERTAACLIRWEHDRGVIVLLTRGLDPAFRLHDKAIATAIEGTWGFGDDQVRQNGDRRALRVADPVHQGAH
jgi:hypothetical protein